MKIAFLATITIFVHVINAENASATSLLAQNFEELTKLAEKIHKTSGTYLPKDYSKTRADAFLNILHAQMTAIEVKEAQTHQTHIQDEGTELKQYYISHVDFLTQDIMMQLESAKGTVEYIRRESIKGCDPTIVAAPDKALDEDNKANDRYEKNPTEQNRLASVEATAIYRKTKLELQYEYTKINIPMAEAGVATYVAAWEWTKALMLLDQTKTKAKERKTQEEKIKQLNEMAKELQHMIVSNEEPKTFIKTCEKIIMSLSKTIEACTRGLY